MTDIGELRLRDLRVVKVDPGEDIWVETEKPLSAEVISRITEQFRDLYPGTRIIFIEPPLRIGNGSRPPTNPGKATC